MALRWCFTRRQTGKLGAAGSWDCRGQLFRCHRCHDPRLQRSSRAWGLKRDLWRSRLSVDEHIYCRCSKSSTVQLAHKCLLLLSPSEIFFVHGCLRFKIHFVTLKVLDPSWPLHRCWSWPGFLHVHLTSLTHLLGVPSWNLFEDFSTFFFGQYLVAAIGNSQCSMIWSLVLAVKISSCAQTLFGRSVLRMCERCFVDMMLGLPMVGHQNQHTETTLMKSAFMLQNAIFYTCKNRLRLLQSEDAILPAMKCSGFLWKKCCAHVVLLCPYSWPLALWLSAPTRYVLCLLFVFSFDVSFGLMHHSIGTSSAWLSNSALWSTGSR